MRVIAGRYRGAKLLSHTGKDLRPTKDMVKGAIFSSLQSCMSPRGRVLDLFAGTGALGIEALSRGWGSAVFVESTAEGVRVIGENLAKLGIAVGDGCSTVVHGDVLHYLKNDLENSLRNTRMEEGEGSEQFSLVLSDPPYNMDVTSDLCELLSEKAVLEDGAIFVEEHARVAVALTSIANFELFKTKDYGITSVRMWRYVK